MRAVFYEIFYRSLVIPFKSRKAQIVNACPINSTYLFFYPVLLVFIFALSSCNSTTTASITENSRDSSPILKLPVLPPVPKEQANWINMACEKWYDQVLKQRGFNGGILVAKNGHIVFEQYSGTAHIPGTDIISENTSLHIASISKTFTAMAILKLWQDGKLNIDDELSKYFPQFNYPGVTIRCLLNHRSGLPNYLYFMEKLGWDQSRFVTNQDVFDFLITRKAELTDITTPCRHFTYCNTNYALLALLIEKVSSKKYADYIKETFFIPLHMDHSFVFSLADTASAAPSYDWRGRLEPLNYLDVVYGDKNVYTTVRDLLTWDRALSCNLIFSKETLDQAYSPYSNERRGIRNYGLGWRMNIYPNGKKMIYHNGWWHGSNASFIRLLSDTATIILIGNKFNRNIYHAKMLTSIFDSNYSPGNEEEDTELFKDLNPTVNFKPDTAASNKPAKKNTGKKPVKKKGRSHKK